MGASTRLSIDQLSSSERIVQVVAKHIDTDPMDLPHLYEAIEPDALDAVIDSLDVGSVAFEYAGEVVTVESDGTIRLAEGPERTPDREPATDE